MLFFHSVTYSLNKVHFIVYLSSSVLDICSKLVQGEQLNNYTSKKNIADLTCNIVKLSIGRLKQVKRSSVFLQI